MIWTAVLGLGLIFALAGDFVLWAKVDEQKQKTADEHANYLAALGLHNAAAEAAQSIEKELERAKAEFDEVNEKRDEAWRRVLSATVDERNDLKARLPVLQDRLSAILCPRNDHVWKDGCCVKCGRVQDG